MKTGIGLSKSAHENLEWLIEEGYFRKPLDVYRFAIGLALAKKINPPEIHNATPTHYNIGSLDPNQAIKQSIEILMRGQLVNIDTYEMAERLAEWGISELASQAKNGKIYFVDLFNKIGA